MNKLKIGKQSDCTISDPDCWKRFASEISLAQEVGVNCRPDIF